MSVSFTLTSIEGTACLELDSAPLLEGGLWRLACMSTCGSHMTVLRQPPPTLQFTTCFPYTLSLNSNRLQVVLRAPSDPGGWA